MNKRALVFLSLLFLAALIYKFLMPHPLYYAFAGSGAELEEVKIQAWAKLKCPLTSEQEMKDLLTALAGQVLPGDDFVYTTHHTEQKHGLAMENTHLYAVVQTFKSPLESYLLFTWKKEVDSGQELAAGVHKMANIFVPLEIRPELSVFLKGSLDKRLAQQEQEQIAKQILTRIGARHLEGISLPEMVSLTGYSPLIKDHLRIGRQKVNLNVATTIDEIRNKTIVRLGTPLLDGEY